MTQEPTGAWNFGCAVLSETWTYAACGSGAAILTVWGWVTGQVPPAWLFVAVLALGSLIGAFRTWQRERLERNAATVELDHLSRPRFQPEVTEVLVTGDSQQPPWITIYTRLVVRNRGADSSIGRWELVVIPPQPARPFIRTEKGISDSPLGPNDLPEGNLLHDHQVIRRGETKAGWLRCEGKADQIGLTPAQMPVVGVYFKDVHGVEYRAVSRPGFEDQLTDIRMGIIR